MPGIWLPGIIFVSKDRNAASAMVIYIHFPIKTLLYTAGIYAFTVALMIILGLFDVSNLAYLASPEQLVLVFYCLVIYSLLVFFLQVNRLLGAGILWKFIRGKYHKPREEERIFMFLD